MADLKRKAGACPCQALGRVEGSVVCAGRRHAVGRGLCIAQTAVSDVQRVFSVIFQVFLPSKSCTFKRERHSFRWGFNFAAAQLPRCLCATRHSLCMQDGQLCARMRAVSHIHMPDGWQERRGSRRQPSSWGARRPTPRHPARECQRHCPAPPPPQVNGRPYRKRIREDRNGRRLTRGDLPRSGCEAGAL